MAKKTSSNNRSAFLKWGNSMLQAIIVIEKNHTLTLMKNVGSNDKMLLRGYVIGTPGP